MAVEVMAWSHLLEVRGGVDVVRGDRRLLRAEWWRMVVSGSARWAAIWTSRKTPGAAGEFLFGGGLNLLGSSRR